MVSNPVTVTNIRQPGSANADGTSHMVASMYNEFADEEGMTFSSFCQFLGHSRLFTAELDHMHVMQIFVQSTGRELRAEGELPPEELHDEPRLDQKTFRSALQAVAIWIYGAGYGLKPSHELPKTGSGQHQSQARRVSGMLASEAASKVAVLQDLLRDAGMRNNECAFSVNSASELRGALYEKEVIEAAYDYEHALRTLFEYYAAEGSNGAVMTGRSVYRLCKASRLVPKCVVIGEFHDVAAKLRSNVRTESKYFQDEKMLQRGEEVNALQPVHNMMHGEPRYSFPQLLELLVAAAMHMPPRVHRATSGERVRRIHEIFNEMLGLPREPSAGFDAELYLQASNNLREDVVSPQQQNLEETSFAEVLQELDSELPRLGPKQDPYIPKPSPLVVDKLVPQPPTVEERIAKAQEKANSGKKVLKKKSRKSKSKVNKEEKVKRLIEGPVRLDQIQWLGKRPVPKQSVTPAMYQADSIARQFNSLDDMIKDQRRQGESHNATTTGCVLRMQIIDEPLRAPDCPRSEQVSTLIETAITSRKLRQYDAAIALLIRARSLWAALEAGHVVPPDWADVHPLVKTPSPWVSGPGVGAPPSRPRRYYCPANVHVGRSGALQSELALSDELILQVQDSSSSALDATLLPRDLRPQSAGIPSRPQSARDTAGPMRRQSNPQIEVDTDTGQHHTQDPPTPLSTVDRRQRLNETRLIREGKENAAPRSARGRSPTSRPATATRSRANERRYDPKTDFTLAAGSGETYLEHLPPQASLFFLCELASLHSAIHEDDLAGRLLWLAREPAQRLPEHDASAAVVWCGLGRVSFHVGHYEMAARFHLKARSIRERMIGEDTIDTATVYNNLACCLAALDRTLEAAAFVELAAEILKELAGEDHPRTQTALRNLEKARNKPKHIAIEVPHLYSLPVKDHRLMYKGRRRKKKKSKSKGKSSGSSRSSKKSGKK
eukprot:TRINITY_DN47319_c0_g1_i1.p1 TRINITY_DN47319_c0_g1~~TRINITY_DN47319_c0_g1_i1.p1  ORF type:complete len:951 (-),score=156.43 TRINITY_DN47319_c0_g1_i1:43-2895(-)